MQDGIQELSQKYEELFAQYRPAGAKLEAVGARQDLVIQSLSCLTVPYCTAVAEKFRSVRFVPNADRRTKNGVLRWNLYDLLSAEFWVVDCPSEPVVCYAAVPSGCNATNLSLFIDT